MRAVNRRRGHPRQRLPALIVLAALAARMTPAAAGEGPATGALIEVAQDQRTLLGIRTAPAVVAGTLDVDGLTAEVTLPVDTSAAVTAPYAGRMVRVFVDEGERVTAGQVLGSVASREFAESGVRLARARADLELARRQARRDEQLLAEGIIAASRAEASRANLRALEAEARALSGLLGSLAQDGAGQAEFALRAPLAGVVVERRVGAGEPVDALAVAFVLAADDAWRVDLRVPAAVAARLGEGDRVRVGDVTAPVGGRGVAMDPETQTVRVWARLPPGTALLPGQRIPARLELRAPPGAVRVPRAGLVWHGPVAHVYVAEPAGYREVPVELLAQSATHATVTGALAAGSAVVVSGTSALKSLSAN